MKVRTFKVLNSKGDIELIYLKPHYGMEQYEIQNVNDYDEDIFNVNIFQLYEKKQQLISFLKDKIKETTPNIKTNYYDEDGFKKAQDINSSNIIMKPAYIVYQEVLDFVNKGGK